MENKDGGSDPDGAGIIDGSTGPDACGVPERCNGVDDDCDGSMDEDFPEKGMDCDGPDADLCTEGTFVCGPDGTITICNDTTGDTPELCDGLNVDDDCDGMPDQDEFMLGDACDSTGDADLCTDGSLVCNTAGTDSQCNDTVPDLVETCNGANDDCDGATDEGTCSAGVRCDGAAGCQCDTSSGCNGCCTGAEACVNPPRGAVRHGRQWLHVLRHALQRLQRRLVSL